MPSKSILGLCCFLAAGHPHGRADGCYVPQQAARKMPAITARCAVSAMAAAACFGLLLSGSMIQRRDRLRETGPTRRYLRARCLPALVVSAGIAGLTYAILPKVPAQRLIVGRASGGPLLFAVSRLKDAVSNDAGLLERDAEQIGIAMLRQLHPSDAPKRQPLVNPHSGSEVTMESSPGNFTIEKAGDKILLRLYDAAGYPDSVQLP